MDRFGRDVDQLRTVVKDVEGYPGQQPLQIAIVQLPNLFTDILQRRNGLLSLAQQNDALHLVVFVVPDPIVVLVDDFFFRFLSGFGMSDFDRLGAGHAQLTLPGLIADDHAAIA